MKKIITIMMIMAVALMALPAMAQQNRRGAYPTYGRSYQPQRTIAPSGSFRSKGSTMMSSGSMYSSSPLLNRNGSAVYNRPSYAPTRKGAGPRRVGLIDWGTGEDETEYDPSTPGILDPGNSYDPEGDYSGSVFDPDPNDEDGAPNGWGTPIGDAMLPLMLLACAYMCLRPFLKRKRTSNG